MSLLPILFWVLFVLALLGTFAPASWLYGPRISSTCLLVLVALLGLRVFPISLR